MSSFEDSILNRIDRGGNPVDRYYYTTNEKFNTKVVQPWNKIRPKLTNFLPRVPEDNQGITYSLAEQKRDQAFLENFEKSPDFVQERSEAAVGLEYVMMEGIHEYGWLGDAAHVTPTNKHDDYVNGLDLIVSVPHPHKENEYLRFGIDTTTSPEQWVIDKKLRRTIGQLKDNKLSTVKYFISDESGERETISVPRFVVAVSAAEASNLQARQAEKDKSLVNDDIQIELIEELEEQAAFAVDQLLSHGDKSVKLETPLEVRRYLNDHPEILETSPVIMEHAAVLNYLGDLRQQKTLGLKDTVHKGFISSSLYRLQKAV